MGRKREREALLEFLGAEVRSYWPHGLPASAIIPKAQHIVLGLRIAIDEIESRKQEGT